MDEISRDGAPREPSVAAVLPCVERDVLRAKLLLQSLERFQHPVRDLMVVAPKADLQALQSELPARMNRLRISFQDELEIVPELDRCLWVSGWQKQQLIKLAAAAVSPHRHCLTLDADVVLTRDVATEEWFDDQDKSCYAKLDEYSHQDWYRGTRAVLNLPYSGPDQLHNVTPAILSKPAMQNLIQYINERLKDGRYSGGCRGISQRLGALAGPCWFRRSEPWRVFLAVSFPWTEYSLYYTYLEAFGHIDRWHYQSRDPLYQVNHCVWWKSEVDGFLGKDLSGFFSNSTLPPFLVIQSNTGIPPDAVAAAVQPHLA